MMLIKWLYFGAVQAKPDTVRQASAADIIQYNLLVSDFLAGAAGPRAGFGRAGGGTDGYFGRGAPKITSASEPEAAPMAISALTDRAQAIRSGQPRHAGGHILVKLDAGADLPGFLARAGKHGLKKRGRIYGSNWYSLSLPPQASVTAAIAIARRGCSCRSFGRPRAP